MNTAQSWITPFIKQCYVTTGVSLNMVSHGLVTGFSAILLPQLREPDSLIKVDETSESWIASSFGITSIIGNFVSSVIMDKFGRKKSNLFSIIVIVVGWYMTVWSSSITSLIAARLIQGLSLGISINLCPVMIGEYTSPRNRGAFLATINLAITCGTITAHTLGSFIRWQTTALVCAIILTIDFFIVLFSPETPSWLMDKGRYEECKTTFRWLRGSNEEEELSRMIKDSVVAQSKKEKEYKSPSRRFLYKLKNFKAMVVKEEFYKPSLIVIHLYILGQWGGATILGLFTSDIFTFVVGNEVNASTMVVTLAIHRLISGIYMTILMNKFRRRTMLISLGSVAVLSILATAGFTYARLKNVLGFGYYTIGVVLIHIQMVSVCSGCLALAFIIAGEVFPLEYKGLAGAISATSISVNLFMIAKPGPYLFAKLGISAVYCIYATVTIYSLVIILLLLPETKGKTLQDIEDEFKKRTPKEETAILEPLTDK